MQKITEVIIVEGRDDTAAVKRAVDAETIETHGFGISGDTWELIRKAADTKGIIIFTDPDHAGEQIRLRISRRFPEARQAFLDRSQAMSGCDIGIENAAPEDIRRALAEVKTVEESGEAVFDINDIWEQGLAGVREASEKRRNIGKILGIGYGNAGAFLRKLNKYGITREEFYEAVRKEHDQRNKENS